MEMSTSLDIERQMDSVVQRSQMIPVTAVGIPPQQTTSKPSTLWYLSFLYEKMSSTNSAEDEKNYPRSDAMCAVFQVLLILGASALILYYQLVNWPQQISSYTTNDPLDTVRGGMVYTCGCSLPPNLQSKKNTAEQIPLKVCHDPASSELETVTVLMFSESVESRISAILEENASTKPLMTKTVDEGFGVTQEAHDLTLLSIDSDNYTQVNDFLTPLYPGGVLELNMYMGLDYIENALLDFPTAYMRMAWMYQCNDCTTCGLDVVNGLSIGGVPINQSGWVSCFYYGGGAERCNIDNSYTAKCVLYPTAAELPVVIAVKTFFTEFRSLSNILGITDMSYGTQVNDLQLDPNILYVNSSLAESRPVRMSFVEVEKGSVIWRTLANNYPNVDKCTNLSPVLICNATSICNVYESGSGYDSAYKHFTNHSQCATLASYEVLSPDNAEYLHQQGEQSADIVCPNSMNCVTSSPYLAVFSTSKRMQSDPLNYFLGSRILFDEWAQHSGVCINTYENVLRYDQQPPVGEVQMSANEEASKATMFLQTECTNSTPTQPNYCWLTGYYHKLTDDPGSDWILLADHIFPTSEDHFTCNQVEAQPFTGWFINSVGVQFGCIFVIQLVFRATFYWIFAPARRFLLDRSAIPLAANDTVGDKRLLSDSQVERSRGDKTLLLDSQIERSHGDCRVGDLQDAAM